MSLVGRSRIAWHEVDGRQRAPSLTIEASLDISRKQTCPTDSWIAVCRKQDAATGSKPPSGLPLMIPANQGCHVGVSSVVDLVFYQFDSL